MKSMKTNFQILVLAIGVIAFWRGAWGLLDLYLFPNNELVSLLISMLIGVLVLYFQDHRLNELF